MTIIKKNRSDIGALIISAGGSPGALDIVRSLGREGVYSAVASAGTDEIAYASKYCSAAIPLLHFGIDSDEENISRLRAYAATQSIPPVLYYISDPELSFVRRNQDDLALIFKFNLPSEFILECLFNKVLFSSFAAAFRLPVPSTTVIGTIEELPQYLGSITFPCIVKPAFSEDWEWDTQEQYERFGPYKDALQKFNTAAELVKFCCALPNRQSGFLIQSYIDGRDERIFSFHGYFDERSRCLGYFIGRKIRTYPPHTGGSTYIQTYHHTQLAVGSITYLQRIKFQGIVKIDYKWDEIESEFKILEINPRYNLWQLLGACAGMNLAYIAYRHQRNETIPALSPCRENVRLLYLKQDVRAYLNGYRRNGEWSFTGYLFSIMNRCFYRVFDPGDMKPFVMSVLGFIFRNILLVPVRDHSSGRQKGPAIVVPSAEIRKLDVVDGPLMKG